VRFYSRALTPMECALLAEAPAKKILPAKDQPGSARFVKLDTTTKGNWKSAGYGPDGWKIFSEGSCVPAYAQMTIHGEICTWSAASRDTRIPVSLNGSDRIAGCWWGTTDSMRVDLNLTDNRTHVVALYSFDWDSHRGIKVDVQDAASGKILDTQKVLDLNSGKWLVWELKGHVKIVFTATTEAQAAILNGIFFGP
jgi:hypothetical protein